MGLLSQSGSLNLWHMSRRERNAAGKKSGNAVAHSAPVLTTPTSPQQPVENRRLSSVQPQSGRGLGRSPRPLEEQQTLGEEDYAQIAELFALLDRWDGHLMAGAVGFVPPIRIVDPGCRHCLIACNCSTPYVNGPKLRDR